MNRVSTDAMHNVSDIAMERLPRHESLQNSDIILKRAIETAVARQNNTCENECHFKNGLVKISEAETSHNKNSNCENEDSFNDNDSGFDSKRSSASEQEINENEKKESPENNTSDNLVNDSFKNSSAFESPKYKNDENDKCKYSSQDIAAILHTRKRIQSTSDDLLRQLDSRINSASSNNTTPANQDKPRSRLSKLHKRYTSYGTIGRKSASKLPPPASPSTVVKDDAATRFSFESCSNNFSPGFSFNTVGRRRSSKPRSKLTISHSFFTAQEAEQDSETSRKIWNIDEGDEDVIRKEEMLAQMVDKPPRLSKKFKSFRNMVRKNPDKIKEASSSKSSTPITPNGRKIPQHFIEEIKSYELNNPLRDEYNHPQYNIENKVFNSICKNASQNSEENKLVKDKKSSKKKGFKKAIISFFSNKKKR